MKYDDFKIFKFSTILKIIDLRRHNFSRIYNNINFKRYKYILVYVTDFVNSIIKYIFSRIHKSINFIRRNFSRIYKNIYFKRYNFSRIYRYLDFRRYNFSKIYRYINIKKYGYVPVYVAGTLVFAAFIYIILLCSIALLILLQFNLLTIILGMSSMILAFTYPYMKRITYWPQLFLGLTFNWGIIMGWTSITNSISIEPIILYLAAIFWTLGYDTIYGLQDMYDDEIIGIKSTSIKFKNNAKVFVGTCYSLYVLFVLILCLMMEIDKYLLALSVFFISTLIYQI